MVGGKCTLGILATTYLVDWNDEVIAIAKIVGGTIAPIIVLVEKPK
jgi:hypothetical protein